MKLSTLLKSFTSVSPEYVDTEITGLQNDSRQIAPGDLFIAYPGAATDGRQYIDRAIQAGATAVLYEPQDSSLSSGSFGNTPLIALPKLSEQLAEIACAFYDNPARKLSITGVTGTNGKTTIAYQLAQAYSLLGKQAAYVGTLGQGSVHSLNVLPNTTPDALCLQRLFSQYVKEGIQQVCMEVSSHALSLGRVGCIDFNQAIYTNLSLDHLDFHQTMHDYALAKASLFARKSLQYAIINQDDDYSQLMLQHLPKNCRPLLYGLTNAADIQATHWESNLAGSVLDVKSPWGTHRLHLQSLGRFNIYNSLSVFASLMASEVASIEDVIGLMSQLKPSPGRMEIVAQNPCVIVDYAHTPDALENVLLTLVDLKPQTLWVVFGCGGDRDRSKRPLMGRIASQLADKVILTNDNPRSEDPDKILQDILKGMPDSHLIKAIPDRREAIHYALSHAGEQNVVLIAGKGHEDYQIIGSQRFAFSDQKVVRELLQQV